MLLSCKKEAKNFSEIKKKERRLPFFFDGACPFCDVASLSSIYFPKRFFCVCGLLVGSPLVFLYSERFLVSARQLTLPSISVTVRLK